ncbi:MAG: protein translocase subunit SecF [Elusimicrobiales bacterium]|nr:protein translocase subunit SecF [Elusimicrobiales bacterium]
MSLKLIPKTKIDFVGKSKLYLILFITVIILGLIIIYLKGLNLGLDFTGGTLLQLKFNQPQDISQLRNILYDKKIDAKIRTYENNSFAFLVKGKQDNVNEYANKIISAFEEKGLKFIEEKRDFVGPVVGRELTKKAFFAIILSMFGIIIYIAFRFSNPIWGISGVIALLHDVFVATIALILVGGELDLVIVAALLTIAGYSINDTIVIYDRIRENIKKFPKMDLYNLINISINETLSRTVITSLTVFMVLIVLYIWGGSSIKDFSFCMLIGTISGVYSTVTIATSFAYMWQKEK